MFFQKWGQRITGKSEVSVKQGISKKTTPSRLRPLRCEPLEDRRMLSITLFVDGDAAPSGDGLAWGTAYNDLQAALSQAAVLNGDTIGSNDVGSIWIAEGTYRPSAKLVSTDARSATFSLLDDVDLYGGFDGTEATLAERDLSTHHTILSGDIGVLGDTVDNAYTVVYCGSSSVEASIDGLWITDGRASGTSSTTPLHKSSGGGVFNSGDLTISNCTIRDNYASVHGGGVCNAASMTISNSTITDNLSSDEGGGVYNYHYTMTIVDTTISDNVANDMGGGIFNLGTLTVRDNLLFQNSARYSGGAIYNSSSIEIINSTIAYNTTSDSVSFGGGIYQTSNYGSLTVTNSTISDNRAMYDGGGIYIANYSSSTTLNNSIVANNVALERGPDICKETAGLLFGSHSLIGDGTNQTLVSGVDGNLVGTSVGPIDPMLSHWTQLSNGAWGYRLLPGSPAIDAGNNTLAVDESGLTLTQDLYGNARIQNGTVDIGSVEGATSPTVPGQVYVVTSLDETIATDGVLTFLEAFTAAQSNQPAGDAVAGSWSEKDTIQFAAGLFGTILVDEGTLTLFGDLSIEGSGCDSLAFDAGGKNALFLIHTRYSVDLSDMTIMNGANRYGGGICNYGTLTVTDCVINNNAAFLYGGGIYNEGGAVTLTDSTLWENTGNNGGGIYNRSGTITIDYSTVSGNAANETTLGGGIYNRDTMVIDGSLVTNNSAYTGGGIYTTGTATITNTTVTDNLGQGIYTSSGTTTVADCTITNNTGGGIRNESGVLIVDGSTISNNLVDGSAGGGIYNYSGNVTLTNSMIVANTAYYGGGIYNYSGTMTVTNSTVIDNFANYFGGGINNDSTATMTLNNSIVTDNNAPSGGPDIFQGINALLSGAYSLIGNGTGQTGLVDGANGNQVGTATMPLDAKLSDWTLLDDGRWGYYLLLGSPALDAGDNLLAVDATGLPLAEDIYGNARIQNGTVDIGAVEGVRAGSAGKTYLVTSLEDKIVTDGVLTFLEAFTAANTNQPVGDAEAGSFSEPDTIQLVTGFSGTVQVVEEALVIAGDLNIECPSDALLIFDAGSQNRVFEIKLGASVNLSGLTVTGGYGDSSGGGVYNAGILNMEDCSIAASSADLYGGGIYNVGTMTLTNSSVTNNLIDNYGGGIYNAGTMTLNYSTVSDNMSGYSGGGIENIGTMFLNNSTVSNNWTDHHGGGVCNTSGTITLVNNVISNNSAMYYGGGLYTYQGSVIFINCMIAGNSTYKGGGVYNNYGQVMVTNSTFTNNTASSSGGGFYVYSDATAPTKLYNSIVANNSAPTGPDISGNSSSVQGSYNLIGNGANQPLVNGVNGNIVGTATVPIDPKLGEWTRFINGLWGYPLLPGSPAIDGGNNTLAVDASGQPLTADFTGNPRIFHNTVDIGAVEYNGFIADAGGPYEALQGNSLLLDASDTFDPFDEIVSYEWDLDADGLFDDASGITVAYDTTITSGVYTVALKVTDAEGNFDIDDTTVTILNTPPVADAGGPYAGDEGETVFLDARGSTDQGNDIVSYEWDFDADGLYDDATGATPSFYRPASNVYTIAVKVTDGGGLWSTDSTTVTINNLPPTANAGGPYRAVEGCFVTLDALGSTDPGNDIVSYLWDFDADGQYDDASGSRVSFSRAVAGDYTVSVKVSDNDGAYSTADAIVSVLVPQTIMVNSLLDNTTLDGLITLREAIVAANTNMPVGDAPAGLPGMDIITFDPALFATGPGTIRFLSANISPFTISDDIDLRGPGAEWLTIDANGAYGALGVSSKTGITAKIVGLTLTGAKAGGSAFSNYNYIANGSSTTISNCVMTGNAGSGILSNAGHISVINCEISENQQGGIRSGRISVMTVNNCRIVNNTATNGGGINNDCDGLTVTNTLVMGNSATGDGGGIFNTSAVIAISNSTITNNTADSHGGGICNYDQTLTTLNNTIVAQNQSGKGPDIYLFSMNSIEGSYNLIGNGSDQNLVHGVDGNQVGSATAPIDPRLDAEGRLLVGSPAIDTGSNSLIPSGILTDLDGNYRIINQTVDIGAYEYGSVPILPGDANYDQRVDGSDSTILAGYWQQKNATWSMGDFNGDGCVDGSDATILAGHWAEEVHAVLPGDANRDGKVDGSDATILAGYWQQANATWSMGDFNGDGYVDGSDATILAGYWQVETIESTIESMTSDTLAEEEPVSEPKAVVSFTPPAAIDSLRVATVPVRSTAPLRRLVASTSLTVVSEDSQKDASTPQKSAADTVFAEQAWHTDDLAAIAGDFFGRGKKKSSSGKFVGKLWWVE